MTLGEGCSVWWGTVIRGDVFPIRIGRRVNLQDLTMIHVTHGEHAVEVEDDVTVGHRAVLHGCTVRRAALIGIGAVVLDAAEVGPRTIVGAGALVPPGAVLEPESLYLGIPARRSRALEESEIALVEGRADHYHQLAGSYLAAGVGQVPAHRSAREGGSA